MLTVAMCGVLLLGLLGAYQVGVRMRRPPSFRRGGAFVEAPRSPSALTGGLPPALADGPFADLGPRGTTPSSARAAPTAGTTEPTTSVSIPPASTTSESTPVGSPRFAASGPASAPAASGLPRPGTYTWNVTGTEGATGFGSRSLPSQMSMVVHGSPGLSGDEAVADLTYSSNHTEREILGAHSTGLCFDFEAGQVRFGPVAQTNQGDYRPPMLQVPTVLAAGAVTRGVSRVLASDGSTERTEDWTVTVVGQDTVVLAGQPVPTWVVRINRQSEPGSSQEITRTRTYWFDPSRHLWVKYTEAEHGQQSYAGITFTYDDHLTATLASFQPA